MIQIDLQFLAGRFHATPWGRHVNEGEPEWPPSPWRLLRALVAAWKSTAPHISERAMRTVLAKLSGPPSFRLPPAAVGHTRHYMPLNGDKTSLVHDAFVVVGRWGPKLSFLWPDQDLSSEEEALLRQLLLGIGYFGRAESWCEATLAEGEQTNPNSVPTHLSLDTSETDSTSLLCADVDVTLEQLMLETSQQQKQGYNRPPGSRWITYKREAASLSGLPKPRRHLASKKTIAVFLIQAPVLPRTAETLWVSDWARQGINGTYGRCHNQEASPNFTGKRNGAMRRDQHRHVFFLPQNSDPWHDRLDRLYLWAPEGFSSKDLEALKSIRSFPDRRRRSSEHSVLDAVETDNKPSEAKDTARFHLIPMALLDDNDRSKVFGCSKVWVSSTPYLCSRHPKRNGTDSPIEQILRECRQRDLPEPRVTAIDGSWLEFKRQRWGKQQHGTPLGFRLEFSEPVQGPLSLGASSHFGMGRFEPKQE